MLVSNTLQSEGRFESQHDMMGGMSHSKLMAANLCDTEGDPIELFLNHLRNDKKDKQEEFSDEGEYADDEEYLDPSTIVGKKLHGPTFDEGYEEEAEKVGHLHIMHIV